MKRNDNDWLAKLLEVPGDLALYFSAQRRDRRNARSRPSAQSLFEMAKGYLFAASIGISQAKFVSEVGAGSV